MPIVAVGAVIARRIPARAGKPGRTVTGEVVRPERAVEAILRRGPRARLDEDAGELIAEVEGQPTRLPDGRVSVQPRYVIDGDVGLGSGHVVHDGVVVVKGEVRPGFQVKAGGLTTRGVRRALIEVDGDMVVDGGIVGAQVRVSGVLRARFVHGSELEVGGDVQIEREVIDSRIDTGGRLSLPRGRLLSSRIRARHGVMAQQIGAGNAQPCELAIGLDETRSRAPPSSS